MAKLTIEDHEKLRLEAKKICEEALEETARSEAQLNEAAQRREQARLEEMAYQREQDRLAGLHRLVEHFPPAGRDPVPLRVLTTPPWKTFRWLLPKVVLVGLVILFARIVYNYFSDQEAWCNKTCQPGIALRCEYFLFSHDKAKVFCITPESRVTVGVRKQGER
jgi:hypothetical protein